MPDQQQLSTDALKSLQGQAGVVGAALVSRDGLPLLSRFSRPANADTVGAMCAAALGAAETALQEFGTEAARRIILESRQLRIVVVGVDERLLLLVVTEASVPAERAVALVDGGLASLRSILTG